MDALLGRNLKLHLDTGDGDLTDISGRVTDIEVNMPADGLMKTHLTLINTQDGPGEIWNLPTLKKPIVRCQYCDSWAAIRTECRNCGGAV